MKVFAISDLHLSFARPKPMDIFGKGWEDFERRLSDNWRASVSDGDVVLIAGDVSWAMAFEDAMSDIGWITDLPGKKVLLRGNHDYWWKSVSAMRAVFPPSCFCIQNDCLRFGRLLVCGTRLWTVPEEGAAQTPADEKIFAREAERLRLTLAAAQKQRADGDLCIVMTHYPPFDSRRRPSLYTELIGAFAPDLCVYGHLHGAAAHCATRVTVGGTSYLLTSLDHLGANPLLLAEL